MKNVLLLLLAYSNSSVFGVHITDMRFCLAPFSFTSALSEYSFSSVLGWINVETKLKSELNISVFMQKRSNVNGALSSMQSLLSESSKLKLATSKRR